MNGTVEVWKAVTGALMGIIVTGALAWFSFGADQFVTEERVRDMIETEAPYIQDRALLVSMMSQVAEILDRVRELELQMVRLSPGE